MLAVLDRARTIHPLVNSPALLFLACVALVGASAFAADATAAPTAPTMLEISPGIYQIGQIRLDQTKHTATFPGKLNMADGTLEYLLVTTEGATHESLLSTTVQPSDLHFAMLLLGAKGAGLTTPGPDDAPPTQINQEYLKHAAKLKGDSIQIAVKWKAGAVEKTAPVEDWIANIETRKSAPRGPWTYTGSMFHGDRFLAQAEGAFASLVTYPAALINNPRKGSDSDLTWAVNTKTVPAVDTPVEIIITLNPVPDAKPVPTK